MFIFLAETRGLSLLQNVQTCSGAHTVSYLMDAGGYCPEIKWLGREVNQLNSLRAEIKNEWSYASTPHMPS
jgi:hypothetical protein